MVFASKDRKRTLHVHSYSSPWVLPKLKHAFCQCTYTINSRLNMGHFNQHVKKADLVVSQARIFLLCILCYANQSNTHRNTCSTVPVSAAPAFSESLYQS